LVTVNLQSISKSFGTSKVIDNLTLEVKDKEFLVLLGPSGCGKTTTLRCIAGLETVDEGQVMMDGRVINDIPPQKRDVAMVFQNYALYPFMKVRDNLSFPLRLRGLQKDTIDRKVNDVAELLRISKLLDRKPRQLSGGEQQRVALGRSLIRDPKLFLMDEPLSNLDAKLRLETRTEIKRLQRQLGITTIFVTHDQAEAMALSDRIAVLDKGILQQTDIPTNIYLKPSNSMVAQFVGSPAMNLLSGSNDPSSKQLLVKLDGETHVWTRPEAKSLSTDPRPRNLLLGFRPEDASFEVSSNSDSSTIPAEVYVTEPVGTYSILSLRVGEKLVKILAPMETEAKIGDKGNISVKHGRVHIFDSATGVRIV
jgi:multiple sugar transport system ATP-binding protein